MKNAGTRYGTIKIEEVNIPVQGIELQGDLQLPEGAHGLVIFAHGSGSSRKSSRNQYVASVLNKAGFATLLFDLLTEEEETVDMYTGKLRFDINLLAERLAGVTAWVQINRWKGGLKTGFFGASTGAAAAIIAAVKLGNSVDAVVSRGGRPDLAADYLDRITAPTLLIIGGHDYEVIRLNRDALASIKATKEIVIVPGATHLFEEPGALEMVARVAAEWFSRYLRASK